MLREFEEKAASEEPEDANAFLWSVQREINEALFWTLEENRSLLGERIAEEMAKDLLGNAVGAASLKPRSLPRQTGLL